MAGIEAKESIKKETKIEDESSEKEINNIDSFQLQSGSINEYELDKDQQKERINLLLLGIATLFLINANFLLVFWIRANGSEKISIPKNMTFEEKVIHGMPIPHLAIYGDAGYVESFSIFEDKTVQDLPQLPSKRPHQGPENQNTPSTSYYQIFSVSYQNYVYFLSCNPQQLVTKVDMDNEGNFETIAGSYIPNYHRMIAQGIQVGNYFWILGGYSVTFAKLKQTTLWVLNKEYWIDGPELLDIINVATTDCFLALNSTTALLINSEHFIYYNFRFKKWDVQENPLDFEYNTFECAILPDKDYKKKLFMIHGDPILKLYQWNLDGNYLEHEFKVAPEGFSNAELINWQHTAEMSVFDCAMLSTLSGTIYLIDGKMRGNNPRPQEMAPIYKISTSGTVSNTNLVLFKTKYAQNIDDFEQYYDVVKTVVYLKRQFKTVQKVL